MSKQLSLVICTYNRDKFIRDCLNSLLKQTLPISKFEVLLINNNCSDNTTSIVDTFISAHPELDLTQYHENNQGLSFARNRGIKEAKTEIITYVDDDAILPPDYLEKVVIIMTTHPNYSGLGGKVIPEYETQQPEWFHPLLQMMVTHIDYGDKIIKCVGKKYPPGCNMTYRKEILEKAGGFNNALKWRTDDKYIFFEVIKIKNEVYYHPELWVRHQIDAERITDQNFDKLSMKLGEEERIRITSKNGLLMPLKILEYLFKYLATFCLYPFFYIQSQSAAGRYIIRFRKLALKGLLK